MAKIRFTVMMDDELDSFENAKAILSRCKAHDDKAQIGIFIPLDSLTEETIANLQRVLATRSEVID